MIDIHCHILPGIDDGPGTLDESVAMCRMAAGDGIRTVVATPHYMFGGKSLTEKQLLDSVESLNRTLEREKITLTVLPGADVAMFPGMADHVAREPWLTVNGTGKYVLTEFPYDTMPPQWKEFLLSLLDKGIIPVVTHPERHPWLMRHPEALHAMAEMGVLIQVTAMSVTGGFGAEPRRFSSYLLKKNLVHLIATDAHGLEYRPPLLEHAVRKAAKIVGQERARDLVMTIPSAVVAGRPVTPPIERDGEREKGGWFRRAFGRAIGGSR